MQLDKKSHVDLDKLNKVPYNKPFEYRDVVCDDFPDSPDGKHTLDGKRFKEEVQKAMYPDINVLEDNGTRLVYIKDRNAIG